MCVSVQQGAEGRNNCRFCGVCFFDFIGLYPTVARVQSSLFIKMTLSHGL